MLTRSDFNPNPIQQFLGWYQEAVKAKIKNPDAMTLATASKEGFPSARIVLFKGINEKGLRFFTNYQSRKGKELLENPYAALVFYWNLLDRQIRVEGTVGCLSPNESDEYWESRPRESRLSALASKQSAIIPNREILEKQILELTLKHEGQDIPRPNHWGGFCLVPNQFEFWLTGDFRLHDRFCYLKKGKDWELVQLSP